MNTTIMYDFPKAKKAYDYSIDKPIQYTIPEEEKNKGVMKKVWLMMIADFILTISMVCVVPRMLGGSETQSTIMFSKIAGAMQIIPLAYVIYLRFKGEPRECKLHALKKVTIYTLLLPVCAFIMVLPILIIWLACEIGSSSLIGLAFFILGVWLLGVWLSYLGFKFKN